MQQLFTRWASSADGASSNPPGPALDGLCERLRQNRCDLAILYYCEWVDRWLFGADLSESGWISGERFSACCLSRKQALEISKRPSQHQEQKWLSVQLGCAAEAWEPLADDAVVVVAREVLGSSVTDDEVRNALDTIPDWLCPPSPIGRVHPPR